MNNATVRVLTAGTLVVILSLVFGAASDDAPGGSRLLLGAGVLLLVIGLIGWVVSPKPLAE